MSRSIAVELLARLLPCEKFAHVDDGSRCYAQTTLSGCFVMNAHRLAEERSLELHRMIAKLIERNPALIDRARKRVHGWAEDRSVAPRYVDAWTRLLDGPFNTLRAMLVDESEEARALRQVTPFAGVVDPRTRWKIWRDVRARMSGNA